MLLGYDPLLSLGFEFNDNGDTAQVNRDTLLQVLSTGEKKALYVLNIIFEVEARKNAGVETVFVFDDIADSFDYKNKYAIIQYMHDISQSPQFKQIVLTHNFDFFRTLESRFVPYKQCLMAFKTSAGLVLKQAAGIKNVFMNDWKPNFFVDGKKKIASIPFMRNVIEYTKGEADPAYQKLTSLLHWKADTNSITESELEAVYTALFGSSGTPSGGSGKVFDLLTREAQNCLSAADGFNFENKIVLAIAIRLTAEQFMITKIADSAFVAGITENQTQKLLSRFKRDFTTDTATISVLHKVGLMTPENIHLNSFMYEPILDMSDEHLRKLYQDVTNLK